MSQHIEGRLLAAGAAFVVALLLFGAALVNAISTEPVEPSYVTPSPVVGDAAEPVGLVSMQAVNEAVAVDAFSDERTPPAEPYRLPGDPVDEPPPPPPPAAPPPPAFRLVGTTQTPTGGVALIQVDNGAPRVVAIGEAMNGYTVQRIDRTSATLAQGDQMLQLQLQQPLSRGQTAGGRRGAQPGPAGRAGMQDAAAQRSILQELQNQLQQRAAQQRGGRGNTAPRVTIDTLSERAPRNDR